MFWFFRIQPRCYLMNYKKLVEDFKEFNTKVLNSVRFGFLWNPKVTKEMKLCFIDEMRSKDLIDIARSWRSCNSSVRSTFRLISIEIIGNTRYLKLMKFNTKVLNFEYFRFWQDLCWIEKKWTVLLFNELQKALGSEDMVQLNPCKSVTSGSREMLEI